MTEDDKKIFIDEGWKAQVQREKEDAAKKVQAGGQEETPAQPDAPADVAAGGGEEIDPNTPSFDALVANLTTQAMMSLGVIVPQGVQQVPIMLDQAAYVIEILAMLQEKTKGNLNPEEEAHIAEAVGELQKIYAVREQQLQEQELRQSGVDLGNLKGGEPQ